MTGRTQKFAHFYRVSNDPKEFSNGFAVALQKIRKINIMS